MHPGLYLDMPYIITRAYTTYNETYVYTYIYTYMYMYSWYTLTSPNSKISHRGSVHVLHANISQNHTGNFKLMHMHWRFLICMLRASPGLWARWDFPGHAARKESLWWVSQVHNKQRYMHACLMYVYLSVCCVYIHQYCGQTCFHWFHEYYAGPRGIVGAPGSPGAPVSSSMNVYLHIC